MFKAVAIFLATSLVGVASLSLFKGSDVASLASLGAIGAPKPAGAVTGTVEAREVSLAPEISGRITGLPFEEGQKVKAGDVIATLDDEEIRLRIARLEARLTAARAEVSSLAAPAATPAIAQQRSRVHEAEVALAEAMSASTRAQDLRTHGATSQADVDNTAFKVRAAEQRLETERRAVRTLEAGGRPVDVQVAEAKAEEQAREIDLARLDEKRSKLLAPMGGVILRRHREVGELVTPGTPVLTLIDSDHLWVELSVDERLHGALVVGQKVELRAEALPGQSLTGRVSFVADRFAFTPKDAQTREDRALLTYRVKVAVDNPPAALKPGMFVDAVLGQ
jgi:HlyD family secretion protein